jgi:thiosulfate/3-mercaptopyruvate sulfurtransferase
MRQKEVSDLDDFLVEPGWLLAHLNAPDIVVIDCSWNIPEANRDTEAEFRAGHIPGARFLDLDAVSDRASPYVNMLPDAQTFWREAARLGVGAERLVVVYDSGYVSARVWWMFRLFGHERVRILNGGWRRWRQEGRPVETGEPRAVAAVPPPPVRTPPPGVAAWTDVMAALRHNDAQVVDARTRERFTGEMPSGYPGVDGGHMPGAINLPWSRMLPQSGAYTFTTPEAAAAIFADAGVDIDRPVIATCGSGITAAVLLFQLARLGRHAVRLYDGSWHEWGQRADLPRVKG